MRYPKGKLHTLCVKCLSLLGKISSHIKFPLCHINNYYKLKQKM